MPVAKDLYRRIRAKDWSEWQWAFSFYDVENWLYVQCVEQNAWIHFSDYTRPGSEVLSFSPGLSLVAFMGKMDAG